MASSDSLSARLGRLFFRLRSFTPIPVILAGLILSWREQTHAGLGGPAVDQALDVIGILLCGAGSLIRGAVVGFTAQHPTQSRTLVAKRLHTEGPYATLRHPMYLGNASITLGLLCIVDQWPAWAVVVPFFVVSYGFIIRAEERHLEQRFDEAFRGWAARVPRFVPRTNPFTPLATLPFDWRLALQRELTPLSAWVIGACVLLGWQWWAQALLVPPRSTGLRVTVFAALLTLALNKGWKRLTRAPHSPLEPAPHDSRP